MDNLNDIFRGEPIIAYYKGKEYIFPFVIERGYRIARYGDIIEENRTKDLTGQVFGDLVVLYRHDVLNEKHKGGVEDRWFCRCLRCGNIVSVSTPNLTQGHVKCCPECKSNKFKDETGNRYGNLTVLSRADDYIWTDSAGHENREVQWYCKCDCGNYTIAKGSQLRSGHTTSCGCNISKASTKHGMHGTRIYRIHQGMKNRCYNPNEDSYKNYGARGITICDEWLGENGFINFYNWAITHGYRDDLTINRINNDGNYEPGNCNWATFKEQANNKRTNRVIEYMGESHTCSEWADIVSIPAYDICNRLDLGWSVEDALTIPLNSYIIKLTNSVGETHTITEWGEIVGLDRNIIYDRIRSGWSVNDAIYTPQLYGYY